MSRSGAPPSASSRDGAPSSAGGSAAGGRGTLRVQGIPQSAGMTYAFQNLCLISEADKRLYAGDKDRLFYVRTVSPETGREMFYTTSTHAAVAAGTVCFNSVQRSEGIYTMDTELQLTPFSPQTMISKAVFCVGPYTPSVQGSAARGPTPSAAAAPGAPAPAPTILDRETVQTAVRATFRHHLFCVGQVYSLDLSGVKLSLTCQELSVSAVDGSPCSDQLGLVVETTVCDVVPRSGTSIRIVGGQQEAPRVFKEKKLDFQSIGIGGLDKEFTDIFRRAFASRIFPRSVVSALGIKHVKGMLLYGPPGTGKTLIARQIGKILDGKEPLIVNGPEILSKFVGEAEAAIRNLFAAAEQEYREMGDNSQLHLLIFDEIDAICKARGSVQDGTGVHDTIVNQLLSKIDGCGEFNNILIIGMTNRRDMLDEALLRPGRLEIQVEIGLPDEEGRVQILTIHTTKMRNSKLLQPDVNIESLAADTKNYSGAELEGVVKAAASHALYRHVDPKNPHIIVDKSPVTVCMADFVKALGDVKPAFGVATNQFEACLRGGMVPCPMSERISAVGQRCLNQIRSSANTHMLTLLLHGPHGVGKTAAAATMALSSDFPFCRIVSPETMVGHTEPSRIARIVKVFEDSYKSPFSVIVLDNIERLLDFVAVGSRFSTAMLQTLLVLLTRLPPPGKKLLIIGTTTLTTPLEAFELSHCFNVHQAVPMLAAEDIDAVLQHSQIMSDRQRARVVETHELEGVLSIKKLMTIIESARSRTHHVTADVFMECFRDCNL